MKFCLLLFTKCLDAKSGPLFLRCGPVLECVRDMCGLCKPWRLVGSACHDFDHHMTWGLTTAVRVVLSTTVATESSRVVSSLV